MGIFSLFGCSKKPDLDESVLIQLKKADSDLSKPHKIEFFLYFPTQVSAEQAAPLIRDEGFEVETRQAAKGTDWICLATKTMIPKLSDLQQIRRDFDKLSASFGGDYDGWGTPVVK
jgi:Regulator of ribonuclease activity B